MTVLVAPDGTRYETTDEAEVKRLTLGHGYRVLDETATDQAAQTDPPPQPGS